MFTTPPKKERVHEVPMSLLDFSAVFADKYKPGAEPTEW
jgi:hypothetical protein